MAQHCERDTPARAAIAFDRSCSLIDARTRDLCTHYAVQFTQLRAVGTPIGANDLWIACHALAIDATLVTNNSSEFKRVKGLQLENWAN